MRHRNLVAALIVGLILPQIIWAEGKSAYIRTLKLESGQDPVTVPENRIWEISGLAPTDDGVTADLYIEGEILIGEPTQYHFEGKYDVTIFQKQTSSLRLLRGTKVSVGDSRIKVKIKEYKDERPQ